MSMEEIADDILLVLLVYNVDNKGKWMEKDLLRIKIREEDFAPALDFLKEKNYIEFKDDEHLRITEEGIDYILQKV